MNNLDFAKKSELIYYNDSYKYNLLYRAGNAECIQRLNPAKHPPTTCSNDILFLPSPPSSFMIACRMPERSNPKISANPFFTLPAYLVTRPTTIPPAALVRMGMIVVGVHL
jgi:hypothetical protein